MPPNSYPLTAGQDHVHSRKKPNQDKTLSIQKLLLEIIYGCSISFLLKETL